MTTRSTTLVVRQRLQAPPAALFRTFVDAERLGSVDGVRRVSVIRPGTDGPESVGTTRRVDLPGRIFLVEEITGLEAPTRFDYRIREATARFDHRFGRIEFLAAGDGSEGTDVVWTTEFAVGGRIVGRLVEPLAAVATRVAFTRMLHAIDRASLQAVER